MSINDILNDDNFLLYCGVFFVVILIFAIPAGIAASKKTNKSIYGDEKSGDTTQYANATVVARRTSPHPLSPTVTLYLVVFEMTNGNRIELAIKDPAVYGTMVEGVSGVLLYRGKQFVRFKRSV